MRLEAEAFGIFSWLVLTFIDWPLITRQRALAVRPYIDSKVLPL
jgi:hypothetical protein